MKFASLTAMLLWAIVSHAFAVDASTPENIARGKRYTMMPPPSYQDTADPSDATQLTDGEYSQGYFWVQKSTVGWARDQKVTLTFDLGADMPISGITFNTAARSAAWVYWPYSIRILVSADGHTYHDHGDLIELNRNRPVPPETRYGVHKFVADELQTHGRYVMLEIEANGTFIVVDEVEIWRGDGAWLQKPVPGKPVRLPMAYDSGDVLTDNVMRRMATDVAMAINIMNEAEIDQALRDRLMGEALRIEAAIGEVPIVDPDGFRAIIPLNDLHAQAYGIIGAVRAAQGKPPLAVWSANAWDYLQPLEQPVDPPAPEMNVAAMRGETRAAVISLANNTAEPITLDATFAGLPSGAMPQYIQPHDVLWTDTRQSVLVAAALPEIETTTDGFSFVLPAGMTRQLWLSVTPRDVSGGTHIGELILSGDGVDQVRVPMTLRVFDIDFPERPTLHLGGWDETNGDKPRYAVNDANRELLIEHLRQRYVDSPWGTPNVMPFGRYDDEGRMIEPPDTRDFETWIKRWPDARRFCVFNNVKNNIAGTKLDDPAFDVKVKQWIDFWVAFLRERDIEPNELVLLLVDEPSSPERAEIIPPWAHAIRAAQPGVVLWEDPTYHDPAEIDYEMFASVDVLCPNRPRLMDAGRPLIDVYLDQKAKGKRLELYSCSGPVRLLDPYSYYRLQAWHCFELGAEATHFWAFGDAGGTRDSWNEYFTKRHSYTPLFVGPDSVTAGRHMEAIRESVQDFEYLVMLRDAIEANPSHARAAEAKALLNAAPRRVLDADGADKVNWNVPKDRSIADTVRVAIGEMLESLR